MTSKFKNKLLPLQQHLSQLVNLSLFLLITYVIISLPLSMSYSFSSLPISLLLSPSSSFHSPLSLSPSLSPSLLPSLLPSSKQEMIKYMQEQQMPWLSLAFESTIADKLRVDYKSVIPHATQLFHILLSYPTCYSVIPHATQLSHMLPSYPTCHSVIPHATHMLPNLCFTYIPSIA